MINYYKVEYTRPYDGVCSVVYGKSIDNTDPVWTNISQACLADGTTSTTDDSYSILKSHVLIITGIKY